MQFVFLDMTGQTLFIRDDAERADWTQEEMTLDADFPYMSEKRISIGQRVYFKDPSTGRDQIYEVKSAQTNEPDHYQQVIAENICISELTDDHMDNLELLEDTTASNALQSVLSGTLWQVGAVSVNPSSRANLSRGSVWQAVLEIKSNWNVYIEPRVTLSANGSISRCLDIISTDGEWNGVRLSVDKNMVDPAVIFDDTEVVTAMYGYGGTIIAETQEDEDTEVDFSGVVWNAENGHPAKPAGQKYIEDPSATAAYGRNGRKRCGFYQNPDILDGELLLQKTWEALKAASKPAISIEGTIVDLYRLGYADQPIKLHDIALVEVKQAGYTDQIQIIRMTTDLLDPSNTTLTIGSYIPNIVYINRTSTENITGTRGGGGGGKNNTPSVRSEFETAIEKNNRMIRLRAYQNDLDDLDNTVKLQEAAITVEHNRITQEVADRRNADGVLSSSIVQTATQIRSEVNNEINGLHSSITQTAYQIRTELSNEAAGLRSSISQTASQIRTEISNEAAGLRSSISQTAAQIRTEISNEVTGLSSSITQNANKISLVVKDKSGGGYEVDTAQIVAGINGQDGSYVKIQANKINLSGYVTASELSATDAKIDNLTSGSTVASSLFGRALHATVSFTCMGYATVWKLININGTGYYILCHN